ncbi:MAG: tetratricopeptide repeat protein [Bacteroidota bacterium]
MNISIVHVIILLASNGWLSIFQLDEDISKELYRNAADFYYDHNQLDSAYYYTSKIFELDKNNLYIGKAYYLNAFMFEKNGDHLNAIENSLNAVKYFRIADDSKREAKSRHLLGNIYYDNYHYEGAIKNYQISAKLFNSIGDQESKGLILRSLGLVLRDSKGYLAAQESFIKSLKIFESLNDQELVATLLNDLGLIELDRNNYNDAKKYFIRSLNLSSSTSLAQVNEAWFNHNMGVLNLQQSKLSEAKLFFEKSIFLMQELEMNKYLPSIYNDLASLNLKEKDTIDASELFELSKNVSLEYGNSTELIEATSNLKNIYKSRSNYDLAFANVDLMELEMKKRLEMTDKLERLNAKYEIVLANSRKEVFAIKQEALYNKRVLIISFTVLFFMVALYSVQIRFKHKKMRFFLSEIDTEVRGEQNP